MLAFKLFRSRGSEKKKKKRHHPPIPFILPEKNMSQRSQATVVNKNKAKLGETFSV